MNFIQNGAINLDARWKISRLISQDPYRTDAQFVERLLEIHHLGAQPFDHYRLGWAQIDAVGARGHIIFARARLT